MKRLLIILGIIMGVLIVFFEAGLSHADTAQIGDEFGFDIPSMKIFIFRLVLLGFVGALSGWGMYLTIIFINALKSSGKRNLSKDEN